MSIRDMRYWEPVIDLRVFRGIAGNALPDFANRVISFELVDDAKKADKASVTLNNQDGELLTLESLSLGVTFSVSYGYVGSMAPPRLLSCRKIRGAMRVGGLGKQGSGPNTSAGGAVNLELVSKVWDLNIHRAVSEADRPRRTAFQSTTIPEIVRTLARQYGYRGTSLYVQDLDNESFHEDYVIPALMSDAEWLTDQAKRRGWVFAIDQDGFHFHAPSRPAATTARDEVLTWFYGDPDVIEWEIEGDLNVPDKAKITGVSASRELVYGTLEGTTRPGDQNDQADAAPAETGRLQAPVAFRLARGQPQQVSGDVLLSVPNPDKRLVEAFEKQFNAAMRKWKLKLKLVGNPNVRARQHLNLQNFGPTVDGRWFVSKATHSFSANQVYVTTVEAKRNAPGVGTRNVVYGTLEGTTRPDQEGGGTRSEAPVAILLASRELRR